ncbi:hypothetical protein L1987_01034 [Smallanthus sonchifolius]|uniref:Uncharacterized protein n=1 Tax=Smallanthus sonchifolius TaxID=185202 RepID=A0ACB9K403_9ASTR|nr:hypothetical protein L1987_01034 [Smallanthus sonchifolius]
MAINVDRKQFAYSVDTWVWELGDVKEFSVKGFNLRVQCGVSVEGKRRGGIRDVDGAMKVGEAVVNATRGKGMKSYMWLGIRGDSVVNRQWRSIVVHRCRSIISNPLRLRNRVQVIVFFSGFSSSSTKAIGFPIRTTRDHRYRNAV